jgi:hypothetical protein
MSSAVMSSAAVWCYQTREAPAKAVRTEGDAVFVLAAYRTHPPAASAGYLLNLPPSILT